MLNPKDGTHPWQRLTSDGLLQIHKAWCDFAEGQDESARSNMEPRWTDKEYLAHKHTWEWAYSEGIETGMAQGADDQAELRRQLDATVGAVQRDEEYERLRNEKNTLRAEYLDFKWQIISILNRALPNEEGLGYHETYAAVLERCSLLSVRYWQGMNEVSDARRERDTALGNLETATLGLNYWREWAAELLDQSVADLTDSAIRDAINDVATAGRTLAETCRQHAETIQELRQANETAFGRHADLNARNINQAREIEELRRQAQNNARVMQRQSERLAAKDEDIRQLHIVNETLEKQLASTSEQLREARKSVTMETPEKAPKLEYVGPEQIRGPLSRAWADKVTNLIDGRSWWVARTPEDAPGVRRQFASQEGAEKWVRDQESEAIREAMERR